jgi:hypothetical protein
MDISENAVIAISKKVTDLASAAGESITLAPALEWGAGFPLFMIIRNWRALKYSKKRPFSAEQVAANFEKGAPSKSSEEQ